MDDLLVLLTSPTPGELLTGWHASGKLASYLPEVERLFGVPQRPEHHPEVDTGIHVAMCLNMAAHIGASQAARFAVLLHDLGKGLTPADELPRHVDHEKRGLEPVAAVCDRLAVPDYWRKLALLVCEHHLHAHRAFEMRSKSLLRLLNETDLELDSELLEDFVAACEADKRGRLGLQGRAYYQGKALRDAARALQGLYMPPGTALTTQAAQELHVQRLAAVRHATAVWKQAHQASKFNQVGC